MQPKPCPFCGASLATCATAGRWSQLLCENCGARGPEAPIGRGGLRCVEVWNQRAEPPQDPATQAAADRWRQAGEAFARREG